MSTLRHCQPIHCYTRSSVVDVSVCLSVCVFVSPAKTAKPIEMPFGQLSDVGPGEPRVRWARRSFKEKGQCLGYPSHWKALESLLRCTEMPLMADSCGPKEPFIRWGQVRTNPFASARGDRTAMRPFFKIIWPLVSVIDIWLVINKCGCITTQDKLLKLLVSFILHANMAVFRETV